MPVEDIARNLIADAKAALAGDDLLARLDHHRVDRLSEIVPGGRFE
jgi:hypothetical protein